MLDTAGTNTTEIAWKWFFAFAGFLKVLGGRELLAANSTCASFFGFALFCIVCACMCATN